MEQLVTWCYRRKLLRRHRSCRKPVQKSIGLQHVRRDWRDWKIGHHRPAGRCEASPGRRSAEGLSQSSLPQLSVFLAMLDDHSPFWKTSNETVCNDQMRNIRLQKNDFEVMNIIMKIVHHQTGMVPTQVSFQMLHEIAVICDKYALRKCLIPWSVMWSQPYLDSVEDDGYEHWLFISMVFWIEDAFTWITRHLILNTSLSASGMLSSFSDVNVEEGIPDNIIGEPFKADWFFDWSNARMIRWNETTTSNCNWSHAKPNSEFYVETTL